VRRSQGRIDIRLSAKLKSHFGTQPAILQNVSKNGAKVSIVNAPKIGSDVILQWHGNEALGQVVWSTGIECGLTLYSALSEEVLRNTLALDSIAHIPEDISAEAAAAKEWAEGSGKFGFD
jgi:hypothetical protein